MRKRRTYPRIPPLPLPGKSPLSLFSTSPGSNESLHEPHLPQHRLPTRSISPARPISPIRPISPTWPSSHSQPRSILDRGRPRSYQPAGISPPLRPVVIRQPRRITSLRRERSSRGQASAREEEKELKPVSPISGLTLLQTLSTSPAPGQAGGSKSAQRVRPVTAPYPGPSSSTISSLSLILSYDAFVDSTFAFQPLEPLVSFTAAVPGVCVSTPPEIFKETQTSAWSTTRSSSSSSMSLTARWRRTFSPTRSALPSEATRALSIERKGKGKADRDQDAPSSSSVLGMQIAKLGHFFSKSKAKKKEEEEKGKGKGKEEKDRDKTKKQTLASTPAGFAFQRTTEYPCRDSQEAGEGDGDEEGEEKQMDEGRDALPGPSGSGTEIQGNPSGSSGSVDKIEMLVKETDLDQIDTPIARRFL
ncbi:hypothetical protein BGZ92_007405 [Podila epicladia]|nr:hypothetical protein BGZ92_007405 [Podila epicladia]